MKMLKCEVCGQECAGPAALATHQDEAAGCRLEAVGTADGKESEGRKQEASCKDHLQVAGGPPQKALPWNVTNRRFVSISNETGRIYCFPRGEKVRIVKPVALSVSPDGTHRILDAMGQGHEVPPGWIRLFWRAKSGQPTFVC